VDPTGAATALDRILELTGPRRRHHPSLVLHEPLVLPVRATGGEPVAELRLHADDAKGLVAHVRQELALRSGAGDA
jgi:hypothetical protein